MNAKHPITSKLNWLGLASVVLAVAELAQDYLPTILVDVAPKTNAWIMLGFGIAVLVLRFVTKTPVSFSAPVRRDPNVID